ncbi:MAG: recombinase RecA [Cytophagales bacterium]
MAKNNVESDLKTTFGTLEKKYGKGIVMRLGDRQKVDLPTISTGSILLNQALGIKGYPRGRIVEVYGPASSGKTTLALHAIASMQRENGRALFIDTEHAFDKAYAKALGVDVDALLFCQPTYGEQACDVAETCVRDGVADIIVLDSVSALLPEAELKGDIGHQNVGGQARLMSQVMRKLTPAIHKANAVCLFINQLRHKIGVMYGSPETTSGGNALKFYASIRLDIRKKSIIKNQQNEPIGHKARIKVVKNKLAAPFKEAIIDIYYGKGVSHVGEIVDIALSFHLLTKSGAWYFHGRNQLGQGRTAAMQRLREDDMLRQSLLKQIQNKIYPPPSMASS